MESSGLEFWSPHSQPILQDVLHQRSTLRLGFVLLQSGEMQGLFGVDRPGTHGQTELDIGLDLSGMRGAVEQPELYGSLGEESVEIEQVMFIST